MWPEASSARPHGRWSESPGFNLAGSLSSAVTGGPSCPPPGSVCVEKSNAIAIRHAKTPAASPKRAFGEMTRAFGGAAGLACEDGAVQSVRGRSATNSSAIESTGRFDAGGLGRAAMSRESRSAASSRDNRARPMASSQGSTPDCASAEITVSGCPCRPSPIEANKNGSNSRPMPGASAACVMPSTHSAWRRSWKELARLPESSAREEQTNRLPGALRLDSETTRFIVIWATKSLVLSALLRIDRDLDRHAQKAVGGPGETSDHRHDLTDVASDPDRNEVEAPTLLFVGSKLIQP